MRAGGNAVRLSFFYRGEERSVTFYQKTSLPNGMRVITERIPHVRSASVGVWVAAGSRWESPENMGISHFIEHLLFKGTPSRTARQIAREIDGRGGNLNAFTSKEQTCFYAKTLDEHLPIAVDVLADMLQHSLFEPAEIAKEKGVVVEEIRMYEDVPDDIVHDLFATALWSGHSLGRPIVGTVETVQSFAREQILAYINQFYRPGNMVVAAAGNLEHDNVVELVARAFSDLPTDMSPAELLTAPTTPLLPRAYLRTKDTEQAHLVVGVRALHHDHADLFALHMLNTVLGGSTSSRLFQEIREDRGLAYSVYSYHTSFRDTGNFAVYAGVSPASLPEVLELVMGGLAKVGREGVTDEELIEAREQLKGQIMLGLESTSGRMNRLGRGELMLGRVLSPDDVLSRIDSVTLEQVRDLAGRLVNESPLVLSAVGPRLTDVDVTARGFVEVTHV